jgi:hypothetical protein
MEAQMKHALAFVAAVALAGVTLAAASTDVTFVMKSGERVAGTFSYNHTDHYQLIVNGRQRDWPSSDIALIEFSGGDPTSDEVNRLPASADPPELERHTLVLKSGEMIRGKIWDFQGDRIFMDLGPNDRRSWNMSDAARLYISAPGSRALFANANRASTTPAGTAPPVTGNRRGRSGTTTPPVVTPPVVTTPPVTGNRRGRTGTSRTSGNGNTFDLPGTSCWMDTGINVTTGQAVAFSATGQVTLSNVSTDTATPAGSTSGRPGQGAPVPTSLLGALIGRIDNYPAFGIGNQTQALAMPQQGRLWIGINDGGCADNSGSFRVTIR